MIARCFYALTAVSLIASSPLHAGIIAHTPTVAILNPAPLDARKGNVAIENNEYIFAWAEQPQVVLAQPLNLDITQPGTSSGGNANLSLGAIPADLAIRSYFLHFDQEGEPGTPTAIQATLTFSSDILGIAVRSETLNATDALLGLPSTDYDDLNGNRGLEFGQGGGADTITLHPDRRTIDLFWHNVNNSDEIRIITAVPEPSTLALAAAAVLGLAMWRLRGRRTT